MHLDDIYFVSDQRAIVSPGDFSDAEARMKCLLPEQYKDLLTLSGLGEFCAYFRLDPRTTCE